MEALRQLLWLIGSNVLPQNVILKETIDIDLQEFILLLYSDLGYEGTEKKREINFSPRMLSAVVANSCKFFPYKQVNTIELQIPSIP